MDTPLSTLVRPRLRLFRRSPSPNGEATPQQGRSLAIHDDDDEFPTPRVQPRPIASPNADPPPRSFPGHASTAIASTETPAARLRALLAREPRSPRSTTPPAPPSEADSTRLASSTTSVTHGSLKDIFSRALREPGDTPQKGRPRRNSFDGSSMEITPVADRYASHRRHARRSLSDEEAEKPKSDRRSGPSFRLSTAVTFDNLRARLASSQSQLMDQNLPDALYEQSSLPSTGTSNSQQFHQASASSQLHSARVNLPPTNITPHPSFQMSAQLGFQSNLLDQDSEMHRAMGDVLNSENEASVSAPVVAQSNAVAANTSPSSLPRERRNSSGPESTPTSHEPDSSPTSFLVDGRTDKEYRPQEEEHNHQREREWNRPRFPSVSSALGTNRRHSQEFHRRLSQEFRSHARTKSFSHESVISQSSAIGPTHRPLERRGSHTSLRSFDDDSRPSSIGSQADYRDRISELERERNHEREREWNKRHPPSRPSSSLSTSSNHSLSHSHSHLPRSPSAIPYLTPTHASLQRRPSHTSLRSDSPVSLASSRDSLKEREQEEQKEITHERERNWNSPRPHWSMSTSPSTSHVKIRNKDANSLRATSSLTRLGDSDVYQDPSRKSIQPQGASPKVNWPAASPASLYKSSDHLDLVTDKGVTSTPQSSPSPGKTLGAASKFGWNFHRSPLPPLELDDAPDRHKGISLAPGTRPSSGASEVIVSSQIPVRSRVKTFSSVDHAASDMSLTHVVGDESSLQVKYQNGLTPTVGPYGRGEPLAGTSWSQEDIVLASDEEPIVDIPTRSTTPKNDPPNPVLEEFDTDAETEVLASPSRDSPQLGAQTSILNAPLHTVNNPPRPQTPIISPEEPSFSATPLGTPPSARTGTRTFTSETSPSFAPVTPPRPTSFGSSVLDFRTPSPPYDLADLPGPPSSDDDGLEGTPSQHQHVDLNPNFTLTKTPKPPGAWAATPLPPKFGRRSPSPSAIFPLESTPPASTSTPLPRASTYPHKRTETATDNSGEHGLHTPADTLSRARSLPLRTPAPPGAWMATPGQSAILNNGAEQSQYGSLGRKKGPLKVRFDVAESDASATEGQSNSPLSAIKLINPALPALKAPMDGGIDTDTEAIVNEVPPVTSVSYRPTTPERPVTPTSRENGPSPRSPRKSPAVRMVDAYGRERVEEGNAKLLVDVTNGHADTSRKAVVLPPTPRRSLVRIVDAMGKEVDDTEIPDPPKNRADMSFEADVSVVSDDSPIERAEALARMRKTLKDLAESLSDADRSEDLELDSTHLEQLEEVSQAARLARNQLAQNLQLETAKQHDLQRKFSVWTRRLLPATAGKPWNTAIIYCGIIIQLILVLAMWRYAHSEARHLFFTTYYDPLYPDFTPVQGNSCFSGALPTTRSWTFLDSYETIRREGWRTVKQEILRALQHIGDQAWERWGEHARLEKPT